MCTPIPPSTLWKRGVTGVVDVQWICEPSASSWVEVEKWQAGPDTGMRDPAAGMVMGGKGGSEIVRS
jgi:hypothetical protein